MVVIDKILVLCYFNLGESMIEYLICKKAFTTGIVVNPSTLKYKSYNKELKTLQVHCKEKISSLDDIDSVLIEIEPVLISFMDSGEDKLGLVFVLEDNTELKAVITPYSTFKEISSKLKAEWRSVGIRI